MARGRTVGQTASRTANPSSRRPAALSPLEAHLQALECEAAKHPPRKYTRVLYAIRGGRPLRLYLGSAEIRVFGRRGKIYAAPNLLFHYVTAHHYKLPDEFIAALRQAACPPQEKYFARLKAVGLDSGETSSNAPPAYEP